MAMFNSYVSLPEGMGYTKAYIIKRSGGLMDYHLSVGKMTTDSDTSLNSKKMSGMGMLWWYGDHQLNHVELNFAQNINHNHLPG